MIRVQNNSSVDSVFRDNPKNLYFINAHTCLLRLLSMLFLVSLLSLHCMKSLHSTMSDMHHRVGFYEPRWISYHVGQIDGVDL